MFRYFALLIGLAALATSAAPVSALAQACGDGVFAEQALASAKAAAPKDSCVLQEWEAAPNGGEAGDSGVTETWKIRAYERFLACYKSSAGHGAVGELGVDTERRRIPSGTRFIATVECSAPESLLSVFVAEDQGELALSPDLLGVHRPRTIARIR